MRHDNQFGEVPKTCVPVALISLCQQNHLISPMHRAIAAKPTHATAQIRPEVKVFPGHVSYPTASQRYRAVRRQGRFGVNPGVNRVLL
jgi:hypothetical protein